MVTIVSGVIVTLIGIIGIKSKIIKKYEVSIIAFIIGIFVITFLKEFLGELLKFVYKKEFLKEILHGFLLGVFFTKFQVKDS